MPNRSQYQPLAQSVEDDVERAGANGAEPSPASSSRRSRGLRRASRPGPIDLSKLDAAFKRWTENIAQKVKGKKKVELDDSRKEIMRSVFDPPILAHIPPPPVVKTLDHGPPMTQADYDELASSVRNAIAEGIHPKMITKGSSGSYFARAKVDGRVQTVAVFKPKDEEPYGRLNPKTTKWLHRQFRWLIPFGRACLIPNLSYISEAAASLLDDRLNLNIVPKTQLVSFSSHAFFYDWLDRNAAKKEETFTRENWKYAVFHARLPSTRGLGGLYEILSMTPRTGQAGAGDEEDINDLEDPDEERALYDASEDDGSSRQFYWSAVLQNSFREELENNLPEFIEPLPKDYIMHNTDRGADNYMIKYCESEHEKKSLVDVAPTRSSLLQMPMMNEVRKEGMISTLPMSAAASTSSPSSQPLPHSSPQPSRAPTAYPAQAPYTRYPHIHIAAIDNSLAFPHEHPKGWRKYTYGWLYLPVSVIGLPFSQKTRDHFLPLLTSKAWWEETTYELRKLFAVDPDFNRKMFRRQLAVIKGQAYNVVQSLKHHDEGPLELTRRQKVLVWDDEVEVADDTITEIFNGPLTASPKPSVKTLPINLPQSPPHRRALSQSAADGSGFPPPMRRSTSDSRPVPFASKLPRVHPGTSGVTVLEHMERVDAVEAGLRRLALDEDTIEEQEGEVDVGLVVASPSSRPSTIQEHEHEDEDEDVRSGSVTPSPHPKGGSALRSSPPLSALRITPVQAPTEQLWTGYERRRQERGSVS
ncbi:phosphatidylinositol 3 and 4-kinase-domain-containing protein [Phellopilus nigrolimitatus]|nr:phosphatidylinositol 3 and 4-kinase-domain-containing protein [Phellopilus nigrolimitatus]